MHVYKENNSKKIAFVRDQKWSPTPNDPQILSHATLNDLRGIIGMEWDDVS